MSGEVCELQVVRVCRTVWYVHHLWNSGLGPSDDHSKAHVQFAQARLRPMVLPAEFFGVKDLNLTLFLGPGFLDWR